MLFLRNMFLNLNIGMHLIRLLSIHMPRDKLVHLNAKCHEVTLILKLMVGVKPGSRDTRGKSSGNKNWMSSSRRLDGAYFSETPPSWDVRPHFFLIAIVNYYLFCKYQLVGKGHDMALDALSLFSNLP